MLILVLAANTSFADFPRLASFHAAGPLPAVAAHQARPAAGVRQRHHRARRRWRRVVTVIFGASVAHLIPLYAIGVFTSFTLSQGGMAKRHLTLKEPGWKTGLWVNGTGAVATLVVGIVIAVTKFTHGAWIIMVIVPGDGRGAGAGQQALRPRGHASSTSPIPTLAIATQQPARRGRAGVPRRRRPRPGDALRRPPRRRPRARGARGTRGPQPRRRVLGPLRLQARVRRRSTAGW